MAKGPLDGIRVLEWAMFHNGPAAGYMLGDLGAEVIKIEPPVTGDFCRGVQSTFDVAMGLPGGRNVQFETANRNKKGIVLDFRKEKGREILYRLASRSDVFLTNFHKNVARRLGADYDDLRLHNPRLIYARNTAFGPDGAWSEKRGFDPVAQALSGAMWRVFGSVDDGEPVIGAGGIFDQTGATLLAYGILAALLARERQGIGQQIDVSLLGGGIHLQAINLNGFLWRGKPMGRYSRKKARQPLTNAYRCADGKWLLLTETQSDRYWHDFCTAIDKPQLEKDDRFASAEARRLHFAEIIPMLDETFAAKAQAEWLRIFQKYEFAYSPIHDYSDVASEPQALTNQYIVEIDHPSLGRTKTIGFPVRFSATPASIRSAAPEFGQHTEEVLLEVGGYSWDEIAEFREQGALG